MGVEEAFPPNNLASHPKRSTISLHHSQEHYMTEIGTVHKTKLNKHNTTIHIWHGNGTLLFRYFPPNMIF